MVDVAAVLASLQLPYAAVPASIFLRRWAWRRDEDGDLLVEVESLPDEEIDVPLGRVAADGWADGVAVVLAYQGAQGSGEVDVIVDADSAVAPLLADLLASVLGVPVTTYDGLR